MRYDVLLHFVGWDKHPESPDASGQVFSVSRPVEFIHAPSVGMKLHLHQMEVGRNAVSSKFASDKVHINPIFTVEVMRFHLHENNVVSVFLEADWDAWGEPLAKVGNYLPLSAIPALEEQIERDGLLSIPPNRTETMEGSFAVNFHETIYLQNAAGQQRIISAGARLQTPMIPPIGSFLEFGPIQHRFEITQQSLETALTPYDNTRQVTGVFYSDITENGQPNIQLDSNLVHEVDLVPAEFEIEAQQIADALVQKLGFWLEEI